MRVLRSAAIVLSLMGGLAVSVSAQDKEEKKEEKNEDKKGPKKERDRISFEELQNPNNKGKDLFTVIRTLRPHFLQAPRGAGSVRSVGADVEQGAVQLRVETPKAQVLVDGNKVGDLEALRSMTASEAEEIRYMNPIQAGNEFGLGFEGGVILIKRVKPKSP